MFVSYLLRLSGFWGDVAAESDGTLTGVRIPIFPMAGCQRPLVPPHALLSLQSPPPGLLTAISPPLKIHLPADRNYPDFQRRLIANHLETDD